MIDSAPQPVGLSPAANARDEPSEPAAHAPETKIRLVFSKTGDLRFISHHDLMRLMERLVRRVGLDLARSRGFNPRPKIVFALALGLGLEGRREVVDLVLASPRRPEDVLAALNEKAPAGLLFLEACATNDPRPPRVVAMRFELPLPPSLRAEAQAAVERLLNATSAPVEKRKADHSRIFDVRPHVLEADVTDQGVLRFRLKADPSGSARPEEVLLALGLAAVPGAAALAPARALVELEP